MTIWTLSCWFNVVFCHRTKTNFIWMRSTSRFRINAFANSFCLKFKYFNDYFSKIRQNCQYSSSARCWFLGFKVILIFWANWTVSMDFAVITGSFCNFVFSNIIWMQIFRLQIVLFSSPFNILREHLLIYQIYRYNYMKQIFIYPFRTSEINIHN